MTGSVRVCSVTLAVVGASLLVPTLADAQSLGDRLKQGLSDAIRRGVEGRRGPSRSPYQSSAIDEIEREQDARIEPRRLRAEAVVQDDIFLPDRYEDMAAYLSARAAYAHHITSRCNARDSRRMTPDTGFRPLSASEQTRRSEVRREMAANCSATGSAYFDEPMQRLRTVLTAWAAARPVTYDGLHALSDARANYRFGWRTFQSDPYGQIARDKVIAVAEPILVQRTEAIEARLRPQIMADARKPDGGTVLEHLFVGDEHRRRSYMSAATTANAAANTAALLASTDPATRVAVAATAALERAPRFAAGRSMGLLKNEGMRLILGGPQSFFVEGRNATCGPTVAGTIPCSYQLRITYQFLGFSVDTSWVDRRDRFRSIGGIYRSPELDTSMASFADAMGSGTNAPNSSPGRDPAKESKEWNDFSRRMRDISRGVTPTM